jgi:hypothetical protein
MMRRVPNVNDGSNGYDGSRDGAYDIIDNYFIVATATSQVKKNLTHIIDEVQSTSPRAVTAVTAIISADSGTKYYSEFLISK